MLWTSAREPIFIQHCSCLPWIESLVFTEYAPANIAWLAENLADGPGEWVWQPFWDLVANLPGYRGVEQPRRQLASRHEIRLLSVFDLPRHEWDMGSMSFVAGGMSSEEAEFESAVRSFLGALTSGAPFMMAFMEGSAGDEVSGVRFPGVRVTPRSLNELLGRLPVTGTGLLRTDNSVRLATTRLRRHALGNGIRWPMTVPDAD